MPRSYVRDSGAEAQVFHQPPRQGPEESQAESVPVFKDM